MLGFLRLLTSRAVMGDNTATITGALGIYDEWSLDPRVELAPGDIRIPLMPDNRQ